MALGEDLVGEPVHMELRAQTENVLIWIQVSADYPRWRAQAMAQRIAKDVLAPLQQLFNFAEPPGVDGDPRLTVAMIFDPEGKRRGYFKPAHTRPRSLYSESNEREMLVVNLARYEEPDFDEAYNFDDAYNFDEAYDFIDKELLSLVAHEYLHVLHFYSDAGEYVWLNESLADYAGFVIAENFLLHSTYRDANRFLKAPETSLLHWQAVEDTIPKYGAGVLFMIYLGEQFGEEIMPRLLAEQANGWRAIIKVLGEFTDISADEVFADWVLANYFLDARRGYGYRALDADLVPPQPAAGMNSFPASYEGNLPQYSTDYFTVDVRGADKLLVRLWQAPEAQLVDEAPIGGDYFAYAVTNDLSNSQLTRAFLLSARRSNWLQYRIWYDLVDGREYGYVTISADDGLSWQTLSGRYTKESRVYSDFYSEGYTGRSGRWLLDRIDLSDYAPGPVLIRFEMMSYFATSYHGMAIDDLSINAIGYHDGFETPDDTWHEAGWIPTDNRLPNNTWLQVVQETGEGLHLDRMLMTGPGDLTVDLLPSANRVVIAISPVVPQTALETKYSLEVNLIDADGNAIVVSRD